MEKLKWFTSGFETPSGKNFIIILEENTCAIIAEVYSQSNAKHIAEMHNNYERLLTENKAWETRFMKLTEDFEEVSAIAQEQAKEISEIKAGLSEFIEALKKHVTECGGE